MYLHQQNADIIEQNGALYFYQHDPRELSYSQGGRVIAFHEQNAGIHNEPCNFTQNEPKIHEQDAGIHQQDSDMHEQNGAIYFIQNEPKIHEQDEAIYSSQAQGAKLIMCGQNEPRTKILF